MSRFFEKISYEQFSKDVLEDFSLYQEYIMPKRSTKYSAGYDFFVIEDITIHPGDIVKIPTGIKVSMYSDEVLFLIIRSSIGVKYNVRLCNQVGVIDSDYYNNTSNEGHIFLKIENEGNKSLIIKKNDAIVQGIFSKYLIVDNEDSIINERIGGLGSTSRRE